MIIRIRTLDAPIVDEPYFARADQLAHARRQQKFQFLGAIAATWLLLIRKTRTRVAENLDDPFRSQQLAPRFEAFQCAHADRYVDETARIAQLRIAKHTSRIDRQN